MLQVPDLSENPKVGHRFGFSGDHRVSRADQNLAASTIGLMAKRGELHIDGETDSRDARFVTRASVEECRTARIGDSSQGKLEGATVPLADVVRFTGRSRIELLDLVRGGVLEEVPRRGTCKLTAASLRTWMTTA